MGGVSRYAGTPHAVYAIGVLKVLAPMQYTPLDLPLMCSALDG